MKPDWAYAPNWAKYLAMDNTGQWFWYECEPRIYKHSNEWGVLVGKIESIDLYENWESTLEQRPSHNDDTKE